MNRKLGIKVAVAAAFLAGGAAQWASLATGSALINPITYVEKDALGDTTEAQVAITFDDTPLLSITQSTDVAKQNGDWHILTHKGNRQFITFSYPVPACNSLSIALERDQDSDVDKVFDDSFEKYTTSDTAHAYFRFHNRNIKSHNYRFNIYLICNGNQKHLDPIIENTGER